jgi:hypothetical protein
MDFPQLKAVLLQVLPNDEDADRVFKVFLIEFVMQGCESEADAWGLISSMSIKRIEELSGLDRDKSQLLKITSRKEQQKLLAPVQLEVVPTDDVGRIHYLLAKDGFEVRKQFDCSVPPSS